MATIYEHKKNVSDTFFLNELKQNIEKFVAINFLFGTIYVYNKKINFFEKYYFNSDVNEIKNVIERYKNYKIIVYYTLWAINNDVKNPINIYHNDLYHIVKFSELKDMYDYLKDI